MSNKIREIRKEKGFTLEELAQRLGTSKQTIQRYETGAINTIPKEKAEAIAEILGTTPAELMGWESGAKSIFSFENIFPLSTKRIPMLGDIACGEPIYASEEHGSFALANNDLDADFCLRAHGDSMTGARIFDGDIVFIRSQDMVDNGEIAAVIIDDEATLKRVYYYPNEAKLLLTPENPRYAPLVYLGDELNHIKILGKAVAFQSLVI